MDERRLQTEVFIYEVDVSAADGSTPGTTWDVHLLHDDGVEADSMAAKAAIEAYEETYGREAGTWDVEVRYVGGVHPIGEATVISVHQQY